jgi:hypothetical protein
MIEMPCISLWRPWADWVSLAWKTIETRLHCRFAGLAGKTIAIHAAERWDDGWLKEAGPYMQSSARWHTENTLRHWKTAGRIVCTVRVVAHRPCAPGDSGPALVDCTRTNRFALVLADPKVIFPPISAKGRQGIFKVEIPEEYL